MTTQANRAGMLRRLLAYVWPHKRLVAVAILLVGALTALEVTVPYLLKVTIDERIAVHARDGLLMIALAFAACVVARGVVSMLLAYTLTLLGQRALHDIRRALHGHILTRSAAFYDRTPIGRILTTLTSDMEAISTMFTGDVITALSDVIILIAILSAMFVLSVQLSLITLVCASVLIPLFRWTGRTIRARTQDVQAKLGDVTSFLIERLSGVATLQALGREQRVVDEHERKARGYIRSGFALNRAWIAPGPIADSVAIIAVALVLWYSGHGDGLTIGLVVAFIEYNNRVFGPINALAQKAGLVQGALAGAERVFAMLDNPDADAPPRELPADATTGDTGFALEFRDIQFAYAAKDPVLHGVSLTVPRGATVAIVGATGSGKSTLVRLLARHYQATAGAIFLDGDDIRDLPVGELRRRVTLVSQDVFLFAGTIADNVRLGRADATAQDVDAALARVGLLGRKPATTVLVERGANLSHGERQLVAFARALVRDPEILLLDEATAHVDPETEQLIERALVEMFAGRTSLIIAHRLATIRRADHIVVMDKGKIVESGTRAELLARGGFYARLEATGNLTEAA